MRLSGTRSQLSKNRSKVLITGINGFAGSHLADLLVGEGYQIFGLTLSNNLENLAQIESQISLAYGDIRDAQAVKKIVAQVQPDYLYHLAGSAFVPDAEANAILVYEVNLMGTLNVLEAVRSLFLKTRVLVVGSGEVYGAVSNEHLPVNEGHSLRPTTPYGVTKACADLAANQYATAYQTDVVRVRAFNHTGPRQSEQFVCSGFAKQLVEIESGIRKPLLHVGNLETRRDFSDVRDVVRGYRTILEEGRRGEVYHIGSGTAWKIGDLLRILLGKSSAGNIGLQQDPARLRSNDLPLMLCDASKLHRELGWKPEIPLEQTLHDLLEYWRERSMQDVPHEI